MASLFLINRKLSQLVNLLITLLISNELSTRYRSHKHCALLPDHCHPGHQHLVLLLHFHQLDLTSDH